MHSLQNIPCLRICVILLVHFELKVKKKIICYNAFLCK